MKMNHKIYQTLILLQKHKFGNLYLNCICLQPSLSLSISKQFFNNLFCEGIDGYWITKYISLKYVSCGEELQQELSSWMNPEWVPAPDY